MGSEMCIRDRWVGYSAGSNGGAAQIGLKPQGSIVFRTDASKANGTTHNPTTRLTIDDEGVRPQGGVLNLKNSGSTGNITANLLGVSGDSRIDLENTGDGNYSGIDFVRERSSGTGVVGGSIFMKSDTSSNNALLYIQAQSASAQSPVTSALSAGNGVRLKLQGGQGIFAVETGASERFRIDPNGKVGINELTNINARLHVQHDALAENILYATRYNDQGNDKPILAITEAQMSAMANSGLVIGPHNRDIHIGPVFGSSANVDTNQVRGLRIDHAGRVGINTATNVSHEYLTVKPIGDNVLDIASVSYTHLTLPTNREV